MRRRRTRCGACVIQAIDPVLAGVGCDNSEMIGFPRRQSRDHLGLSTPVLVAVCGAFCIGSGCEPVIKMRNCRNRGSPAYRAAGGRGTLADIAEPSLGTSWKAKH